MNLTSLLSNDKLNRAWIAEKNIKIYVRKSMRMLDSTTPIPCLDLATVEVAKKQRGKGVFKSFLKRFEEEAKRLNRSVFVENIQEPRLVLYLTKRGYSFVTGTVFFCPCMFKHLS